MERISEHISYKEAIKSRTAVRYNISNTPSKEQLQNMRALAENVFEPVRQLVGKPIYISSFFRSKELNKRIGGSQKSQHCKGEAMDIDADIYGGWTNARIFNYIKDNLDFDQLIWEFGTKDNPAWVHVSFKKDGGNRKQVLRAKRINDKTKYFAWQHG